VIQRPPVAYAYGRISHRDGFEKNESVPSQIKRAEAFYKTNLEPRGVLWGGAEHDDKQVSAYKQPFFKRKAGMRLLEKMKKGDFLIVDNMPRMCRRVMDFSEVNTILHNTGITLCFVDFFGCTLQQGTPMGDLMLHFAVSMAQFESAMCSHRIRLSKQMRRDDNLWDYSHPLVGMKVHGKGKNRTLVWDWEKRKIMGDIVRYRKEYKLTFQQIAIILETQRLKDLGQPIPDNINSAFCDKFWTWSRVKTTYTRERLYQRLKNLQPAEIQRYRISRDAKSNKTPIWSDDDIRATGSRDASPVDSGAAGTGS
jgi:DNA invertase Pin-like site-specific DNA recombinase